MKILMLTGSPHAQGATARLADEYEARARALGHELTRVDAARLDVKPCLGCDRCRENDGRCVHSDGMRSVLDSVVAADAVVLVTPLYYFGMTSQLKAVIDRFYAMNDILRRGRTSCQLIAAGADAEGWAMDGIRVHFETLCRYMRWENRGCLLALDVPTPESLEGSEWLEMAGRLAEELE